MSKFQIDESKIVILTGYLISTSAHLYVTVGTEQRSENFIWILGLSAMYIVGFFIYLYSKKCTFGLQIAEYILLPFSGFFTIQCMDYFRNEGFQNKKTQAAFIFIMFFLIQIFAFFKIYYLNQTFSNKQNQNILRFQNIGRFFRISKNILACSCFMILPQKDYFTSVIVLGCLDFLINCIKITFLKLELQQCMCFCNINNIVSITVLGFFGLNNKAISLLWTIFIDVCLICLNMGLKYSISSSIMELKLKFYFQNFKATPIDFTTLKHKQNIVYLLSCFRSIYLFEKSSNKILINPHAQQKWSKSFLFQIKNMYLFAFMSYLSDLQEQNFKTRRSSQTQNLTQTKQIRKIRSLKTQKSLFQGKGQINVEDAYEKVFGIKMTTQQILENKKIFFFFLGFCMDHLEQKENLKLPWSYSSQFFLIFAMDLGRNFMIKSTEIYHRRNTLINESIFYKVRNDKFYDYIKTYQTKYDVGFTLVQKYMLFEDEFENLKDKMLLVCEDELKFLKKLTDQTNDSLNPFDIEDDLIQRKENKRKIFQLLQKCAKNQHSINCSDFAYIFLLLMVGIQKSISQTTNLTHNYFRIPSKSKKTPNQQLQFLENKNLSLQPVLVCSAFSINGSSQMGELTMFNSQFKQKFGININDFQITKRKITDLLPLFQSKTLHDQAMNKKNLFQFENEENVKTQQFHDELTCYLKINQEKQNFHVLQSWNVAVRMFYNYQGEVSYVCTLKQSSNDVFLFQSDFEKLSISQKSIIQLGPNSRYSQLQFDLIINLVRVDMEQLILLGLFRNPILFNDEQQNVMYGEIEMGLDMGQQQKMKKVQSSIYNQFTSHYKTKLAFSIIFIFAIQIITLYLIYYGDQKAKQARNLSLEIEKYVSGPQSCQIKVAESFFFLKNAYQNQFWNILFSYFIPNFRQYMFSQIQECTSSRKTEFLKKFFAENIQSTPILNSEKLQQIMPINATGMSKSQVDFSNIMYSISSTSDWFLSKDLSKLTTEQRAQFNVFMKSISSPYKDTISYKFLNYTIATNERTIKDIQINYQFVFIALTSTSCLLFLLAVSFMIWTFLDTYKQYMLLWKLDSSYFDRQIRKIHFIMKQIQKTRKYEFTKCTFTTTNLFTYEYKNFQDSFQFELTVADFEQKLSQKVNDEAILNIPLKNPHSGKLKQIVYGKKYIFGTFLIGFILHICFSVMIWKQNEKIVVNGIRINNILGQAGITKMTLPAIQLSSWMILLNQRSYRPLNETLQIFQQSYDYLKHLSFYLMFYDIEDKSILSETLYLSVCQVMSINNLMETAECEYLLGILSTIRVSQFLSFITDSFYQLIPRIGADLIYSLTSLAVLFLVNYLFMVPSLIAMIQMIIAKIDVKHHIRIAELKKQYYIIICVFMAVFLIQLLLDLRKKRNLKGQILTMDTLDNLNKNEHFQPVLNKLYYSNFC